MLLVGAALWITSWDVARYIFAIGAIVFAVGRFFYTHEDSTLTLRRLYTQQVIGAVFAVLAALAMFFHESLNGVELFDYVVRATASAWILPFTIFVVLEVYTTFRISHELKKQNK